MEGNNRYQRNTKFGNSISNRGWKVNQGWKSPRISNVSSHMPSFIDPDPTLKHKKIKSFFIPGTKTWDILSLNQTFCPTSVQAIIQIHVPNSKGVDKLIWHPAIDGVFFVKFAYKLIKLQNENGNNSGIWNKIWKARAHERHKMMLWRIVFNVLPCRANLCQSIHILDPSCPLCGASEENSIHLFTICPLAQILWRQSPELMGYYLICLELQVSGRDGESLS